MDPLSTIASVISVVQAVAETKKFVALIREIPEAQTQYEEFANELVVLEYMVRNASPTLTPHPVIGIVETQLEKLLSDLRNVEKKCTSESGSSKMLKAKKYRWLLEGNEIQRLRDRASRVKQDLSVVLGLEQQTVIHNEREEKVLFQKRLDQFMLRQESMLQILVEDRTPQTIDHGRIEELHEDSKEEDKEFYASQPPTAEQPSTAPAYGPEMPQHTPNPVRAKLTLWEGISPMMSSGCSEKCQCHCHYRQSHKNRTGWIESFFKSLNLSCSSSSRQAEECIQNCKAGIRGRSIRFDARLPAWLQREWPDIRLNLSLRPRKVISLEASVLKYTRSPVEIIYDYMKTGFDIFPDEETEYGVGLVELAMRFGGFDFLEVLLKVVWKNLLPRQRLPRNVFFAANHYLESTELQLNDRQTHLLELAKSYADNDEISERRTDLYNALLQGQSIDSALQNQPWAVNELDYTGLGPIHIAARNNDLGALEALLKANADVNLRDYEGMTVLMHSVGHGHLEFSKRLVAAKCQVNARSQDGGNVFHFAMAWGPEMCFELLKMGASPAVADASGLTPLHTMGVVVGNEVANMEKIRLLVAAGANLEARTQVGHTPAFFALSRANFDAFRWFIQAGASLFSIDNRGQNLLHYVASHPDIQLLEYIRSLRIYGLNTQHEDTDDDTPWDTFIYTLKIPYLRNGFGKPITQQQKQTFAQLYQEIRDRNLQYSIDCLERVQRCMAQAEKGDAVQVLEPLIQRADDWNQDDLLFSCHDIKVAILEGNWANGMEIAKQSIADLKAAMQTSPWDQKSWYDEPPNEGGNEAGNGNKVSEPECQENEIPKDLHT